MDSEAPISSPPEQPPPLTAEDSPSGGDDGFETASDPDVKDSAAPPPAIPAPKIAVRDENPTKVDENPDLEENSEDRVAADVDGAEEEEEEEEGAGSLGNGGSEPAAGTVVAEPPAAEEPDAAEPAVDEGKKVLLDVQDENFEDAPEGVEESTTPIGALDGIGDGGAPESVSSSAIQGAGDSSLLKEDVVTVAGDEDEVAVDALIPVKPIALIDENPAKVDENLEPEEYSGSKVPAVEEEGPDSGLLNEENQPAVVEAEPQNIVVRAENKGVPDPGEEKDKNLVDGQSEPVADPVAEGSVVASEPAAEEPDAAKVVADYGKKGVLDAAGENTEESLSTAVEGVEESKTAGAVIGIGDDGVLDALSTKEENSNVGGSQPSTAIQESGDSNSLKDELVLAAADVAEVAGDAGSNQDRESAADLKVLDVESDAAVEVEKDGGVVAAYPSKILDREVDSKPIKAESSAAEDEKAGADCGAISNQGLVMVNASSPELCKLEGNEPKLGVAGAENGEGSKEGSLVVDSESAHSLDSADKPEGGKAIEAIVGVGVDVKDVERDDSISEIASHSADNNDVGSDGEGVDEDTYLNLDKEEEKVVRESTEEVESSPVLEEESRSRDVKPVSFSDQVVKPEAVGAAAFTGDDEKLGLDETEEEEEGLVSEGLARVAILESSETAKLIIKEMEEGSASVSSHSGFRSSGEQSRHMDGQIVLDSDEEADTDEEDEGRELFDSAALTALLKAATGASADGGVSISSQDGTRIFSVDRPAGLGSSIPSLRPATLRSSRPSPFNPSDLSVVGEPENDMDEDEKKLQEKVEQIRVKFLRLVQRLGHSPDDTVAAQVLYRLGLAEGIRRGRHIGRAASIESTKKKAMQLEEDKKEDLDFSCNILVLGKTGVGKSATINSIFGESKSHTNAFQPATTSVREITGTVDGVKIRVIDTPGLRASVMDQSANKKVLQSIKKYTKRCPPDIVLYVDRIDTQTRDFNDLPLLRSVTTILGSSIWFNAIVALSHAASAPPDGPNGSPLSYEVFVAQRSHVVQHSIRQAAGDMRLMNPVALVENHPSCRRNREGERVLPNGLSWRPQLLLLCYSSKILSEANSLLKLQDPSPGKLFGFRLRSPPLPYLLSSLLQSRAHPKLSTDQGGDNGDSDIDLDDLSDTDQEEEEDEYDQLPPFKPLRKTQIAKLTKEQRRAYFDEYDYRVKLLQKKQWKGELRRMKEMRKKGKTQPDDFAYGDMVDDYDQDGAPAAVPVPLPDMVLPPSFDCNNPVYRYRFLEPTSQLLIRPVLDSHGWDHDCGYDGVSIEENLAVAGRFPAGVAVQITKDKKEFNLHLDSSISAKHGENGSSLAGFDIQSIGKQLAYIVRGETKFKNFKKNKTAAGVSVTFLGETVATGLKIEDQFSIGKRVNLVASAGGVRAQGDVAYGANLEARLRDKDYPLGQTLSTLGLSLMRWRNDLALGANLQSQFSIGRNSKMSVRVGLNNKLSGQITVRTSTSEQLQIALVAILPLAISFFRRDGESYMVN